MNIHVTISDGLIILAMLIYGGEIAVLIAVIETTFAALNLYRKGLAIKPRTIVTNVVIAAIAVFSCVKGGIDDLRPDRPNTSAERLH